MMSPLLTETVKTVESKIEEKEEIREFISACFQQSTEKTGVNET